MFTVNDWFELFPYILILAGAVALGLRQFIGRKRPSAKAQVRQQMSLRQPIEALQQPALHDIRIRDKSGRAIHIKHIVRLPASIVIIATIPGPLTGDIDGHLHRRRWTITDHGTVKPFINPVIQLEPIFLAFRRRFPLLKVRPLVVFPNTVTFVDETPGGACNLADFTTVMKSWIAQDGTISEITEITWPQVVSLAENLRREAKESVAAAARHRSRALPTASKNTV